MSGRSIYNKNYVNDCSAKACFEKAKVMMRIVKNFLKTNKLFWKYRHLIHKDVWQNYYESYASDRRNFYSEYVIASRCKSVFEFGCASGPNLKNIQSFSNQKVFCFGFDINREAIKFAEENFDEKTSFFTSVLDNLSLELKLKEWGVEFFDFAIYDRVLYLLDEAEVIKHFADFGHLFSTVVIDDFHNTEFVDHNAAYQSKNYQELLLQSGFYLLENCKSAHAVNELFFERSARRLIFKRL